MRGILEKMRKRIHKMGLHRAILGDCIDADKTIDLNSVDLIYLDPPFFTQKIQQQKNREGTKHFSFHDLWANDSEYADYLVQRLLRLKPLLKDTGSIFFHCDKTASHIARLLLDSVFGEENFCSEIIWYFKRWSNSKKGLLSAHQTIFFYSKSRDFKFNKIMQEYSASTNVDQIMQKRARDSKGKSVYARSEDGKILNGGAKKGVPLSDVWEIPFLNPKAKERVGYPTQKPVLLLNRIIELVTDEDDLVLDPFCGSGTTLVAAKQLKRRAIGYDTSEDAVNLTNERLANPVVTTSTLMENGRESYNQHSKEAREILNGIDYTPVHRNSGIDALLKHEIDGRPVFLRIQKQGETTLDSLVSLKRSTKTKGECIRILIKTSADSVDLSEYLEGVYIIPSTSCLLHDFLSTGDRQKQDTSSQKPSKTPADLKSP